MLAHPWLGLAVLTLVMAVYFVVEGIWKIVASFSFRPATGWLAVLASGVIGLVLGGLIWMQWPLSGLWAVGILVGVDLHRDRRFRTGDQTYRNGSPAIS